MVDKKLDKPTAWVAVKKLKQPQGSDPCDWAPPPCPGTSGLCTVKDVSHGPDQSQPWPRSHHAGFPRVRLGDFG